MAAIQPDCALCAALLIQNASKASQQDKPVQDDNQDSLVANIDLSWNSIGRPSQFKVCFTDDNRDQTAIQTRILDYAKLWLGSGLIENIELVPNYDTYDQEAHIRIRIVPKYDEHGNSNTNYSYVGIDSLFENTASVESMNLALIGVPDEEDADGINMFRRRVLHEFGHAFGFLHEQVRVPWETGGPKVVFPETAATATETAAGNRNPTIGEMIVAQAAKVGNDNVMVYGSLYDSKSIMMYPYIEHGIDWNTVLSDDDKKYAHECYPKLA